MSDKSKKMNAIGLEKSDYRGAKSTLCTGCGHDSVTNHLVTALFQSGLNPYKVAKLSGIGCSSKTPTYFLEKSHGFNSIHGRMAPVATGVKLANSSLTTLGISGDGDSMSIGIGGLTHLIRRNLPMVYIIENNGVYGLTKGQFSATADQETTLKSGVKNPFTAMDICSLAIELGCDFVARSFSGDAKQLVPILDAAFRHNGTAIIDVISPCITFANHEGSTKSFNAVKEHLVHLQEMGFIQPQEEIKVDYDEGETQVVDLPDGSHLILKKVDSKSFELMNRINSIRSLHEAREKGQILTGLFYFNQSSDSLVDICQIPKTPLALLKEDELRPSSEQLQEMMSEFR